MWNAVAEPKSLVDYEYDGSSRGKLDGGGPSDDWDVMKRFIGIAVG